MFSVIEGLLNNQSFFFVCFFSNLTHSLHKMLGLLRKARYFCPFPWISWTCCITIHTLNGFILNAPFFQKLGNNTQKHADTFRMGFLNILSGKCSYFIFNLWSFFLFSLFFLHFKFCFWAPSSTFWTRFTLYTPLVPLSLYYPSCIFAHPLSPCQFSGSCSMIRIVYL